MLAQNARVQFAVGWSLCGVFTCSFFVRREATTPSAFVAASSLKSAWCVPCFTLCQPWGCCVSSNLNTSAITSGLRSQILRSFPNLHFAESLIFCQLSSWWFSWECFVALLIPSSLFELKVFVHVDGLVCSSLVSMRVRFIIDLCAVAKAEGQMNEWIID